MKKKKILKGKSVAQYTDDAMYKQYFATKMTQGLMNSQRFVSVAVKCHPNMSFEIMLSLFHDSITWNTNDAITIGEMGRSAWNDIMPGEWPAKAIGNRIFTFEKIIVIKCANNNDCDFLRMLGSVVAYRA